MARPQKASAPAEEHNETQTEQRQEAADRSTNVVDLKAAERIRERQTLIVQLAGELDKVAADAGTIKDRMKSIRLRAKEHAIDWKALQQLTTQRRAKEAKRLAWEKSRREIARAFGWEDGKQVDMFEDRAEGLTPGQQREFLGPTDDPTDPSVQRDPAVAAALNAGFFTEDELQRSRDLEDVDNRDAPDEGEGEDEDDADA